MRMRTCLIIEDDDLVRETLCEVLTLQGYAVSMASNGEDGIALVKTNKGKNEFDAILADLQLPGMSGIEVIRSVKHISPHTACIILTGHASVESAVDAMKAGAFTYLKKPFRRDELLVTLDKAHEMTSLKNENVNLKKEIKESASSAILGTSAEIMKVRDVIAKIADTDTTALILGESGTGKELVARALHYGSARSGKPFVPINCGAIPEELLESELFGHEKGAFTGAVSTKIGRFEAADHGTIFLDEIGDMSPGLQVKILRVIQERQFVRVGGGNPVNIDVRVVAATNQDLEAAVDEKRFRKDLYYRLNVIPIHLPSLRERKEDIQVLAKEFVQRSALRKKKSVKGVSPETLQLLESYDWPGNIRELENTIERIVVLKEDSGLITPKELPDRIKAKKTVSLVAGDAAHAIGVDFNAVVGAFERELIMNALNSVNGVKKKAAEYLHLNRTTLIEKMKRMGIAEHDRADDSEKQEKLGSSSKDRDLPA